VHGNIRHGFVYERVPHITLKSIANNAEIDVIWDKWQEKLEPLREKLNAAPKRTWQEWEIPREAEAKWSDATEEAPRRLVGGPHRPAEGDRRLDRRQGRVRVPLRQALRGQEEGPRRRPVHRREPEPAPHARRGRERRADRPAERDQPRVPGKQSFPQMILENLKVAGVQQAHKEDKITFVSLAPWPGELVCAEGRYLEGETEKRAAIFIGPEFGTVQRADLVAAAREAGDAGFDVLIACAFNYEAHTTEFNKLGRLPVLKARMNADLHMAEDLKNTGKGNLFVIFGEPDIEMLSRSRRPGAREGERRRRLQPADRRGRQRRRRRHRLLVHRHRLQRGELLRPPRLLPRRERPLQRAQDHAEGRDRRRRLGDAEQRHVAPVRKPRSAASRSRSSITSATR
jgi:adenine-specific DNA-methyltransferase